MFEYQRAIYRALMEPSYTNSKVSVISLHLSLTERIERNKKIREGQFAVYSTNKVKHVATLKASGLGISELVLRLMAWLCLKDDSLKGSQMIIFTGPRLELAVSLIHRLKVYLSRMEYPLRIKKLSVI